MEIEIDGHTYRTEKLGALPSFHVARRIAPVLGTVGEMARLFAVAKEHGSEGVEAVLEAVVPMADALSKMEDSDADYIIGTCLAVVLRKEGAGWAKVWSDGGLMFDDISMPAMIQMVIAVLRANLSDFFPQPLASE